jgi:putative lipoic acid-binding regulatory protein
LKIENPKTRKRSFSKKGNYNAIVTKVTARKIDQVRNAAIQESNRRMLQNARVLTVVFDFLRNQSKESK